MKNKFTDEFEKHTGYCYASMQALNGLINRAIACNCSVEILLKANLSLLKEDNAKFIKGYGKRSDLKFRYLVTDSFIKAHYKGVSRYFKGEEYLEEVELAMAVAANKPVMVLDDDALFTSSEALHLLGSKAVSTAYTNKTLKQIPAVRKGRLIYYKGKELADFINNNRKAKKNEKISRFY